MRYALFLASCALFAQSSSTDAPLTALPYSPSLDVTSMDRTVDPCVDFYRYSCGAWIKKNPIPPDQSSWDVYGKLAEDNRRFLWGILEEAAKPSPNRSQVETEIGDYFHACMDEATVEKAGLAPLKTDLAAIAALKSTADLPSLLAHLHLTSVNALFNFTSAQDFADSTHFIAFANAGGLGLPDRDYYVKTDKKSMETRAKYLVHVAKLLELAGETRIKAKADAQIIMAIETALAKASLTRVQQRDPYNLFHKMTAEQLQALTPSFHWGPYFKASDVPDAAAINVSEPAFYKELQRQLKLRALADWKTYLRFHLLNDKASYLTSAFVTENFDFFGKYLRGLEQMPARWKQCVQRVDRDLGEALGKVFVEKTFGPDTKQRTQAMTKEVELAMGNEIEKLPWMGPETKKKALEKLHAIVNKIGYPDKWRDYSSITIARDDYEGNVDRATIFESHRQLNKIGKPLDRTEWDMTPPTVNADYNPQMNDINFPAGVLQPPLFDPKMDDAPNYGDTGATIGHELTHGFDDEGRHFDGEGNLKDWWTKKDAEEFEERASCISNQYSQYTVVDDIKGNGKLTLGEDLADLGGTFLAYLAWKHATENQNLQPIDGLTPDQRFFVGMAQWACGDERPESKRLNQITNPHSLLEFRVNGVVSNMPEFGRAFACKVGQPMVHEQPCKVW
ncbi:MAG TPA: M13 family metallopeptidase [Bryobacteraceae bacterium]|nr:M13 family metallopeptidase [Bryobacteraceae bacterium]